MTRKLGEVLLTQASVLELVDLMDDRRETGDAGVEAVPALEEDEAFHLWQAFWGHLADDVDLPPDVKASLGTSSHVAAVEAVQAVLEAAHKYFGIDRRRLIDLARNEGPPESYVAGKPVGR